MKVDEALSVYDDYMKTRNTDSNANGLKDDEGNKESEATAA